MATSSVPKAPAGRSPRGRWQSWSPRVTLRLLDTLTARSGHSSCSNSSNVAIYSCGPTVYGPAHVGNFRSFLFADLLVRYLRYRGYTSAG